jgi:hypothetical protein
MRVWLWAKGAYNMRRGKQPGFKPRSKHVQERTLLEPSEESVGVAPAMPGASLVMPAVPAMGPGATPATRMPSTPHSRARLRVMLSTAALAAEACAWGRGWGGVGWGAG